MGETDGSNLIPLKLMSIGVDALLLLDLAGCMITVYSSIFGIFSVWSGMEQGFPLDSLLVGGLKVFLMCDLIFTFFGGGCKF